MSRYRTDWDDEYEGSGRPRRRREYYSDERYDPRDDYEGGFDRGDARANDGYAERRFERSDVGPYGRRFDYDEEERYGPPRGRREYYFYERRPWGRDLEYERDYPPRRRGASRSHVRCRDIMTRDVTVAQRDTTLEQVARLMRDEDTGVIPVVQRDSVNLTDLAVEKPKLDRVEPNVIGSTGKLVGLITDRDIAVRAVAEGKDPRSVRAEEIMTTDIHTAQPNDRVIEAIRKMGDKQVRRIPVVDREGNLRGIISMADVALETEQDRELAEALEEISSGSSFWNRVFG